MGKSVKLRSTCVSVLLLLASVSASSDSETSNVESIQSSMASDCDSVASFIEKDFDEFVRQYNASNGEGSFSASSVENSFPIVIDIVGEKYNGVFFDFDSDNGYAVLGDNFNFYDFVTSGESPYKNIVSLSYCYSTVCGYLYLRNDEYVSVDESRNYTDEDLANLTFNNPYDGQSEAGCGNIYEPETYIKEKYGTGWALYYAKALSMATGKWTKQVDLSCYIYIKLTNGSFDQWSEGNCWFVSAYNILQSLADAKYIYKTKVDTYKTDSTKSNMPKISQMVDYDPLLSEPSIYSQYFDSQGHNHSGTVTSKDGETRYNVVRSESNRFPELYTKVREYVVSKYNKIDNGSVYKTANIINQIGTQYGYTFKAKGTIAAGLYCCSGFKAIDRHLPFGLCTALVSNGGYGDHIMAGCGYQIYYKESGWWIFKNKYYKYFYEVRDGHSNVKTYFDLSAWTGFGGFILLDYSSSNY